MKTLYRISPGLTNGKNAWQVLFVKDYGGSECTSSIGFFSSLKRAKSVVAHLRKKPIEFPIRTRSSE